MYGEDLTILLTKEIILGGICKLFLRITLKLGLERTCASSIPNCSKQGQLQSQSQLLSWSRLLRAVFSQALNISEDADCTTTGHLYPHLTTLMVKNFHNV